jgi:beta-glucosidase
VSAAVTDLDRLLHAAVWNPDGSVSNAAAALALLAPAARELASTQAESFTQSDGVVSVARDIAQAIVVGQGGPTATTSPLIADADDELLNDHPDVAVALLTEAAGFAPGNACTSGTVTGSPSAPAAPCTPPARGSPDP